MSVHVNQRLWSKPTFIQAFELFEDAIYDQPRNFRSKRLWLLLNDKRDQIDLVFDEADGGKLNIADYGYTQLWVNYRDAGRRQLLGAALNDASEKYNKSLAPRDLRGERPSFEITLKPTLWDLTEFGAVEWRIARYGMTIAHEFAIHAAYYCDFYEQIRARGTADRGGLNHCAQIWNGLGDEREQHRAVFEDDTFGLHGEYRGVMKSMIKFTNNESLKKELKAQYEVDVTEHSSQERVIALKSKILGWFA